MHASFVDGKFAQGATEALSTHAGQHGEAEVAVGGLIKVLEAPKMVSVLAYVLKK